MKKIVMGVVFVAMACFILPGASLAGKKAQTGDRDGTPDRERLKDGSCQDLIQPNSTVLLAAGKKARSGDRDGTPDRKRLKDGSCQSLIQPNTALLLVAGKKAGTGDQDGIPDQDRLRDDSCLDG